MRVRRCAHAASCSACRRVVSLLCLSAQDACCPLAAAPITDAGLAAVRVNYPYQAAMLSAFRPSPPTDTDPLPRNVANVIVADDGSVQQTNVAPGGPVDDGSIGPYAGPFGLGRQLALAGRTVRPFRRLVSAQAIFRREVFE